MNIRTVKKTSLLSDVSLNCHRHLALQAITCLLHTRPSSTKLQINLVFQQKNQPDNDTAFAASLSTVK